MIPKLTLGLFVAVVVAVPFRSVAAQDTTAKPSAAQMAGMLDRQMTAMGPMMAHMATAMMTATYDNLAQPETAEKLATFLRNYYKALIAKGFSSEEAMRIVASVGLPAVGGAR